ncbi:MAG: hypothetical protein JWM93_1851 [Frankiales bacterium]|nr:hypothetical protein [Frankiales bacterium]
MTTATLQPATSSDRLHVARLGVAAAAAGLLAMAPLPAILRGILLLAFVVAGPGAALATWVRLPRALLLAVVPTFGLAAVVLASSIAVMIGRIAPQSVAVVLAIPCAALCGTGWMREAR